MRRDLRQLADNHFDILIIGGGILGAGVARDATLRGLRVALVDQADFASGTSSRSTKLIHGGFRYLEHGAFGLVAESCRERRILQQLAPHLVKPQPFLFTVYEGDARPLWQVRAGMTLYDLLARYRNTRPHQSLSATRTLLKEPTLRRQGLRGSVLFYDCQEDDARFCLENILDAAERGAAVANYCAVTGFEVREERIVAVQITDRLRSDTFEIHANTIVNAAGPWVADVAGLAPFAKDSLRLSPTKGVHLLLPRLTQGNGIFWQARDGRLVFVVPWLDCTILGATDTDYTGDAGDVHADAGDVDYLLTELRRAMPDVAADESAIITSFAGVRPLLHSAGAPTNRSREHRIVQQGRNLFSVAGGKYTTYRAIAEQVVDAIGARRQRGLSATMPLPVHRPAPSGAMIAPTPDVWESDILHAGEYEMATSVSDVMRRRTSLALSRFGDQAVAEKVAAILASILGWNPAQQQQQVAQYLAERAAGTL